VIEEEFIIEIPILLPCSPAHAATVANWPSSADEATKWCGEGDFPVSAQRVADWQLDDDVRAYLLVVDDVPCGYGELWLDAEEDEVELARIIVAPAARGRGLGRTLVLRLLAEAAKDGWSDVFMRVHPDNHRALRCYQGIGFRPVDAALAEEWNEDQPFDYVWLQHHDRS
jgi:ribosomal protein S18 acetylase RimI-like enzyme